MKKASIIARIIVLIAIWAYICLFLHAAINAAMHAHKADGLIEWVLIDTINALKLFGLSLLPITLSWFALAPKMHEIKEFIK